LPNVSQPIIVTYDDDHISVHTKGIQRIRLDRYDKGNRDEANQAIRVLDYIRDTVDRSEAKRD